jgi:two-component sensor histidine kinase
MDERIPPRKMGTPRSEKSRPHRFHEGAARSVVTSQATNGSAHRLAADSAVSKPQLTRRERQEPSASRSNPVHDRLVRELNHRLRNVFPTILTIIKHTATYYPQATEFREALEGRLRALSAASGLANDRSGNSVDIGELLQLELAPFQIGNNVHMCGPSIAIPPILAQDLAIILHELTTNAAKHGALRDTRGRLSVTWSRSAEPCGKDAVALEWIERGGPPTLPPETSGFGMTIIQESGALLGGKSSVEFAPEGLRYRLTLPAERATAGP